MDDYLGHVGAEIGTVMVDNANANEDVNENESGAGGGVGGVSDMMPYTELNESDVEVVVTGK